MEEVTIFVLLLVSLLTQKSYSAELDIISDSRFLTENDTLVSPARTFELGFFKPDSSENTYVGIWYKKISVKTVVWVANRDYPLTGVSSGRVLRIVNPGNLVLMNNTSNVVWSSNTRSSGNAAAQLLNTGNLVITDGNHMNIILQSFDYPTDTNLPGMKCGEDKLRRIKWGLSSWKSSQDPGIGKFTWSVDTHGYPQFLLRDGSVIKYWEGPWNGERFSGSTWPSKNKYFSYNMVVNETEALISYDLLDGSVLTRSTLNSSGHRERSVWLEEKKRWEVFVTHPEDTCATYNICGAYGSCNNADPQTLCSCLVEEKFEPVNKTGWEKGYWAGGCARRIPLNCKDGTDGFIKYRNVKLPDTRTSWFNNAMSLRECKSICLQNCSCMAYANTDIRGKGSGCLLWFNDLLDMKASSKGGQNIYVRMASSELENERGKNIKIILIGVFLGIFVEV